MSAFAARTSEQRDTQPVGSDAGECRQGRACRPQRSGSTGSPALGPASAPPEGPTGAIATAPRCPTRRPSPRARPSAGEGWGRGPCRASVSVAAWGPPAVALHGGAQLDDTSGSVRRGCGCGHHFLNGSAIDYWLNHTPNGAGLAGPDAAGGDALSAPALTALRQRWKVPCCH